MGLFRNLIDGILGGGARVADVHNAHLVERGSNSEPEESFIATDREPWTHENSGKRVKAIREALGRTQEQFARMLNVSQVTLCRWERGKHVPAPVYRQILEGWEKKYVRPKGEEGHRESDIREENTGDVKKSPREALRPMIPKVKYIKEAIETAGISIAEMSALTHVSRTSLHNWFKGGNVTDRLRLSLVYRYSQCLNKAVKENLLPLCIDRPKEERLKRIRAAVEKIEHQK